MGRIDKSSKAFNLRDACLGVNMNDMEQAVYNSRQSLAARLGISVQDVLFYLSGRNLTRQNTRAVSVRRASDSKTSVIPFRPNVAYDAPRNLLHYDPVTWAEWALGSYGHVVNGDGSLTFNIPNAYSDIQIIPIIKPSTKYGWLLNVVESAITTGLAHAGACFTEGAMIVPVGGVTGNIKAVLTSTASPSGYVALKRWANQYGTVRIRDIRVFELPAGSQIEADFTNLTADALAAKYQMCGANGAPIGAVPGVAKDRIANAFANGDGRYGTVGWSGYGGAISARPNGARITGDGSQAEVRAYAGSNLMIFPNTATRKHFFKVKLSRPVGSTDLMIGVYNGTTARNTSVASQLAAGSTGWVKVAIAQTDLGVSAALRFDARAVFPDSATASGKILDVEYFTIAIMGDSAADPLYNYTAEQMDVYLRTQPGVVLTPDGEYYVPPYGLCPGEQDLDVTAAFGGTSQLYDTYAYGQEANTNDATQSTAASQPKIWDNGLSWPGLGLFDGNDDYMAADLPDITAGPATWWAKVNHVAGNNGYIVFAGGQSVAEAQYAWFAESALQQLYLAGSNIVSILLPNSTDDIAAFVWDGATITPYTKVNGIVTAGAPVAFAGPLTSRVNKFIGCRSAAVDGSVRSVFYKGTLYEIGITKTALTPAQIAKL